MNNIYEEESDLVIQSGCASWDDLVEWFGGMTEAEILVEADTCWPGDDNRNFAARIYDAVGGE